MTDEDTKARGSQRTGQAKRQSNIRTQAPQSQGSFRPPSHLAPRPLPGAGRKAAATPGHGPGRGAAQKPGSSDPGSVLQPRERRMTRPTGVISSTGDRGQRVNPQLGGGGREGVSGGRVCWSLGSCLCWSGEPTHQNPTPLTRHRVCRLNPDQDRGPKHGTDHHPAHVLA